MLFFEGSVKIFGNFIILLGLAFLIVLIDSRNAFAYIDPATGSYLLQILLAGLLGALFTLKIYWRNVKSFVANLFSKNSNKQDDISA